MSKKEPQRSPSIPVITPQGREAAIAAFTKIRKAELQKRSEVLDKIAKARGSTILTYVTAGRKNLGAQIGGDSIPIFRDHLGELGNVDKLDLLLITRGGHALTPLRLVSLLREFSKEVRVLIPYMALSAGTLIALGADEIVMGAMGELGPVDPSVSNIFNPVQEVEDSLKGNLPTPRPRLPISVEDVTSFLDLALKRAKLDSSGMSAAFSALTDNIHPLALGNIMRQHTLIRHMVRRLLSMHMDVDAEKEQIETIAETMTEKLYAHDYLITRDEAERTGLKVVKPSSDVEGWMWDLYKLYESFLKLEKEVDFNKFLGKNKQKYYCMDIALIENGTSAHAYPVRGLVERTATDNFEFKAESSGWEPI